VVEHHVDSDSTAVFDSVHGEWAMLAWKQPVKCGERDGPYSATEGVVRVLDERN
jgi:hypothetical protein